MPPVRQGIGTYRRRALRVAVRFVALAAVAYVIAYEPIVPFFPVCYEGGPDDLVRYTCYGAVTDEFAEALHYHQYPENRRHIGGMMLMSVEEWTLGYWFPEEITNRAIWHIIEERHGIDRDDLTAGVVRLPEFEKRWPTCAAVRAIVLEGGKWSREGPSPIWYIYAGMPRPAGFVTVRAAILPYREPGGDAGEDFLAHCLKIAAFGAAAGYLLAIWRERNVLRYLSMGGLYGALLGLATPLIFYFIGYLANETPLRGLLGL